LPEYSYKFKYPRNTDAVEVIQHSREMLDNAPLKRLIRGTAGAARGIGLPLMARGAALPFQAGAAAFGGVRLLTHSAGRTPIGGALRAIMVDAPAAIVAAPFKILGKGIEAGLHQMRGDMNAAIEVFNPELAAARRMGQAAGIAEDAPAVARLAEKHEGLIEDIRRTQKEYHPLHRRARKGQYLAPEEISELEALMGRGRALERERVGVVHELSKLRGAGGLNLVNPAGRMQAMKGTFGRTVARGITVGGLGAVGFAAVALTLAAPSGRKKRILEVGGESEQAKAMYVNYPGTANTPHGAVDGDLVFAAHNLHGSGRGGSYL